MKILFDHQTFQSQEFGGISRYFSEVIPRLGTVPDLQVIAHMGFFKNRYGLEKAQRANLKVLSWSRVESPRAWWWAAKVNRLAMPVIEKLWQPDLVHLTYYKMPLGMGKRPLVVTLYDMIHEQYPESFLPGDPTPQWKRRSLARADHVIAISQDAKNACVQILKIPEEKITVVHLASSFDGVPSGQALWDRPYFLFVGARGGYKNFETLVQAFEASAQLKEFGLLAVGGGKLTPQEAERVKALANKGRFRWMVGGDNELATAYAGAVALVYPSKAEGFGIPPLEAMQCGCPVIAARAASIPEVVGEAALLVSPNSVEELKFALEKTAFDSAFRASLIERGRLRCKDFSWDRCAEEHLRVYRQFQR